MTQRQLEVEPPSPPAAPVPDPPTRSPAAPRAASASVDPSNRGLLERQLRWHRERAKFEANRPAEEGKR
ncbi:MAG: hypothetical protein WBW47_03445 [Thermoplasmata archaeon]